MRVCVIGSGYVGLVTAACLADSGNDVVAMDVDAEKVARLSRGECPIFERGLEELLRANVAAKRLRFTTRLSDAVAGAAVIFIVVGTPSGHDGAADLSIVESVVRDVGSALTGPAVIVTKSTVPVGTADRLATLVAGIVAHPVQVVSNPEFLKEGTAVDDFIRPDRVVIGSDAGPEATAAGDLVAALYKPFVRNNKPIVRMSRAAAELTKYAANAYLATRISFINEIAAICERTGVNVDEVRQGMGLDARIGQHFLYPGLGYGGSCFPKDVRALAHTARAAGIESEILEAVDARNTEQRRHVLGWIHDRLGPDLRGCALAVWGLAFKPNTDDVREAPAITLIEALLAAGAVVAVHDPRAISNTRALLGDRVTYCADAYEALTGGECAPASGGPVGTAEPPGNRPDRAAALIICTEWMEYRNPDFHRIRRSLRQPLIFDGRNLYDPGAMARLGFEYFSVGRPAARPKADA
jgi:UDPglucose 6-dehydrogenase